MNLVRFTAILLTVVLVAGCTPKSAPQPSPQTPKAASSQQGEQTQAEVWTCPMHPEVRESKPGKCPKCGMDLVLMKKSESGQKPAEEEPSQTR